MAGIESKVIIEVGLNESQLKSANPNVPYSPQEIADEARRCYEAGAAVVHYHARDPLTFQTSTDLALNLETQRLISESTPLIAYPTYGDRIPVLGGHYEICSPARDRFAHIRSMVTSDVRMEVGPIDLGSAFDLNAYRISDVGLGPGVGGAAAGAGFSLSKGHQINNGEDHVWLARFCDEHGLSKTFAAFDCVHLLNLRNLIDMGHVPDEIVRLKLFFPTARILPTRFQGMLAQARELFTDKTLCWMPVVYFGDGFPLAALSIAEGGHVRTGIGDYHYAEQGCPTNAQLVERMVMLIRAFGKEPATPDEARAIQGMAPLGVREATLAPA